MILKRIDDVNPKFDFYMIKDIYISNGVYCVLESHSSYIYLCVGGVCLHTDSRQRISISISVSPYPDPFVP